MAMSALERFGPPATMTCPQRACAKSFACDACMHGHLRRQHNTGYADAFGPVHDAYVDFCETHAACTPSMLGI